MMKNDMKIILDKEYKWESIKNDSMRCYYTNLESVCAGLNELLVLDSNDSAFEMSRRALYQAQLSSFFELTGFERTHESADLQDALAEAAFNNLEECFPIFRSSRI